MRQRPLSQLKQRNNKSQLNINQQKRTQHSLGRTEINDQQLPQGQFSNKPPANFPIELSKTTAKIDRHQQSKDKYRSYIKKIQNNKQEEQQKYNNVQKDIVSTPGQFIIIPQTANQQNRNRSMTSNLNASNFQKTQDLNKSNLNLTNNNKLQPILQVKSQHRQRSAQTFHSGKQNPYNKQFPEIQKTQDLSFQQHNRVHTENDNFPQQKESFLYNDLESENQDLIGENQEQSYFLQNKQQQQEQEIKPIVTKNLKMINNKQQYINKSTRVIQELIHNSVQKEGSIYSKKQQNEERIRKAKIQPITDSFYSKTNQMSATNSFMQSKNIQNDQITVITDKSRPVSAFIAKQIQRDSSSNQIYNKDIKNINHNKDQFNQTSKYFQEVIEKENSTQINKLKHSYVAPKVKLKHVQGYNVVQLTKQDFRKQYLQQEQNEKQQRESLKTAIDYKKQSPFLYNNDLAEEIISQQLNVVTNKQHQQIVRDKILDQQSDKKGFFLPLDYYNLDDEDYHPEIIMQKYKDPSTGELFGYSKWQMNNGQFEWRRCKVLEYVEKDERYKIEWQTGKSKMVSRVNLRFERENQEEFNKKLEAAEYYREISEIFMKYNYMIDSQQIKSCILSHQIIDNINLFISNFTLEIHNIKDPIVWYLKREEKFQSFMIKDSYEQLKDNDKKINLKNDIKNINDLKPNSKQSKNQNDKKYIRIKTVRPTYEWFQEPNFQKIFTGDIKQATKIINQKYNQNTLKSLILEVQQEFQRSNKKILFDNNLPFNEDKKKLFQNYLPEEMFQSILEKPTLNTDNTRKTMLGITDEIITQATFLDTFQIIQSTINRGELQILKRLQYIQNDYINFQNIYMVPIQLDEYKTIDKLKQIFRKKYENQIEELTLRVSDHSQEVATIVQNKILEIKEKNEEYERRRVQEKKQDTLSDEFISKIVRLSNCINYLYEDIGKQQFLNSMDKFYNYLNIIINQYKQVNNLDQIENNLIDETLFIEYLQNQKYTQILNPNFKFTLNVTLFKIEIPKEEKDDNKKNEKKETLQSENNEGDKKTFDYSIQPKDWMQAIMDIFEDIVKKINQIQCFKIKEECFPKNNYKSDIKKENYKKDKFNALKEKIRYKRVQQQKREAVKDNDNSKVNESNVRNYNLNKDEIKGKTLVREQKKQKLIKTLRKLQAKEYGYVRKSKKLKIYNQDNQRHLDELENLEYLEDLEDNFDIFTVQDLKELENFKDTQYYKDLENQKTQEDPFIKSQREKFSIITQQMQQMAEIYLNKIHNEFQFMIDSTDSKKDQKSHHHKSKKESSKHKFEDIKEQLLKLKNAQKQMNICLFANTIHVGCFKIDTTSLRELFQDLIQKGIKKQNENLVNLVQKITLKYQKDLENLAEKIDIDPEKNPLPQNIEELDKKFNYCNVGLIDEIKLLHRKIQDLFNHVYTISEIFYYKIDEQYLDQIWVLYELPWKLLIEKDEYLQKLKNQQKKLSEELVQNRNEMLQNIAILKVDLEELQMQTDLSKLEEIFKEYDLKNQLIQDMLSQSKVINYREQILKWEQTDLSEMDKLYDIFEPYFQVWKLANLYKYTNIMQDSLNQLNRDEVKNEIQGSWEILYKLEKNEFKQIIHMRELTKEIRQQYESLKPYLPLINDLRNPSMEKANWKALNSVIEEHNRNNPVEKHILLFNIEEDQQANLKTLVQNNIMLIQDDIREISEISSKERGFEKILNKMKQEWKPIKVTLSSYKDSGTFILKEIDPIIDKLDEDIAKTISIASSPFAKFMEQEISKQRSSFQMLQDLLEYWLKAQKLWQYLQPIFSSDDIKRELPKEKEKFEQVNDTWKQIMQTTFANPSCMELGNQPRIKENLTNMIDVLEHIVKSLNAFLNKKRLAFPRFYFLSNDELLQILSQTKDVRQVQNHLQKCFEGIDKLVFQEDNLITHFNSSMEESIEFLVPTDPNSKENKYGEIENKYVEEWLSEIENGMKDTLSQLLIESYKDENMIKNRKNWLVFWPSQIVLCAEQTLWTSEVTESINNQNQDSESLQKCYQDHHQKLLEIVEMVRGDLSKIDRITLGCLITLNVHANDVVQELAKEKIESINEFEWLSQMRYYLKPKIHLEVQMVTTQRAYGFEYLGNQGRLVITPLTDRCYRTLMSALQQNLGGAPEGPAGTGKTETTKDLAKAIGKHCVVFNCSDSLDYLAMAKFFKGLCCCGSWACFDEFNRIDLEVLSVIASQILTIQTNIMKQRTPGQFFDFEGDSIPLNPSCAVFITMNPGYAGRSELPDNLKALFRPVAMMIPSYTMISEISLYSFGFTQAKELSIKITTSLKLASEQLSTQSHYDYGMRAVKAIITAAGAFKRQFPYEKEQILVLKAISDCNLPKFTSKDVPLFSAIINDLFPEDKYQDQDYGKLEEQIEEICDRRQLELKDRFRKKIFELYETIQVRHGLMIVGQTNSGKTSIINTLQSAIELDNFKTAYECMDFEERTQLEEQFIEIPVEMSPTKKRFLMGESPVKKRNFLDNQPDEVIKNPAQQRKEMIEEMKWEMFQNNKHSLQFQRIHRFECNPKAVSSKILFGDVDLASGDWVDGITALLFRESNESPKDDLKWVLFDGPVDALWIENMNTVLDDNKKLCLSNGETIKMCNGMNIIFEVEDLLEASPATVSRCGMVFMENKDLGYQVYFKKWFNELPENLKYKDYLEYYNILFDLFIEKIANFVNTFKTSIKVDNMWLATNFLKLYECFLLNNQNKVKVIQNLELLREKTEAREKAARMRGEKIQEQKIEFNEKTRGRIFASFIMAIVWSFGAILENNTQRKQFNIHLHDLLKNVLEENESTLQIMRKANPLGQDITEIDFFDIFFNLEQYQWVPWMKNTNYQIPQTCKQFSEIFIPTTDFLRHNYILNSLVTNSHAVLFYGPTGTGKTMICKDYLMKSDENQYIISITSFSANITAAQVQDVLELKLEKQKRRKGVYGPLIGHSNVIFVDDINMPVKEQYGSQPPLELIRQWFSQGGWYDRKTLEFNKIVDIQFVAAMGVGRPNLSQRLLKNFNLVYLTDLADETLNFMLTKILEWGFNPSPNNVKTHIPKLVDATINIYKDIAKQFLPLPKKSHYVFNLRDIMKVIQGILSVNPESYPTEENNFGENLFRLQRLWFFECQRVFSDRLVDKQDKNLFNQITDNILKQSLFTSLQELISSDQPQQLPLKTSNNQKQSLKNSQQKDQNDKSQSFIETESKIMFGNFMNDDMQYEEIRDIESIKSAIQQFIEKYNSQNKKQLDDIILFEDAISMICKLNRIISQPFGNALLIGLGGSGSRTLTRLSTSMQSYNLYEIEIEQDFTMNEWYEFLRKMLKEIVEKQRNSVFLISDGQIQNEQFLEDINNLLNIGEIPNLFQGDDKESLIADIKPILEKQKMSLNSSSIWQYFVSQCKERLHIVLSLSPIGTKLRTRLRNFPSLVSCTSPIWVQPWSESALEEVSLHQLLKSQEKFNLTTEQLESISQIFLGMHKTIQDILPEYLSSTGNHFYVTETIYLKLLRIFQSMYETQLESTQAKVQKYQIGIKKLNECEEIVKQLQEDVIQKEPILENKTKEMEQMTIDVNLQKKSAEEKKEIVMKDEIDTKAQADIAEKIQIECKDKLKEAEPQLFQAIKALKTLDKKDFIEMKSFTKPPENIKITMEAICIMMQCKGKKVQGSQQIDFWEDSQKLLKEPAKFLDKLEQYDRDNMPEAIINKLTAFFEKYPQFKPSNVAKSSKAAEGLCLWCKAIYGYYFVNKKIMPLRMELDDANKKFAIANQNLKQKQEELSEVISNCQRLQAELDEAKLVQERLKQEIKECKIKKNRAEDLINSLSGEKIRWNENVTTYTQQIVQLLGDVLLSCGFISYLGAFTAYFRNKIVQQFWIPMVESNQIICDKNFNLPNCIGDPTLIQEWILYGLPMEQVSKENAIIMNTSKDWPLIIDPQQQATNWIKLFQNKDSENNDGILIAKPGDQLIFQLAKAIQNGKQILIEDCQENLEPIIEHVLVKENVRMEQGFKVIQIGNDQIIYNDDFRLYLVCSLPNPHFTPEVLTKACLLNFNITLEGLNDQMASIVTSLEDSKLQEENIKLMEENSENQIKLFEMEENILNLLKTTEGYKILDDETLVNSLKESKQTSEYIKVRMKESQITEEKIKNLHADYSDVTKLASSIYFTVLKLRNLDYMYQFSLQLYINVFKKAIKMAEKPIEKKQTLRVQKRVQNIIESLKRCVFYEINRSIFVKHKILFNIMLSITDLKFKNQIADSQYQFLLSGLSGQPIQDIQNIDKQFFTEKQWNQILELNNIEGFQGITDSIIKNQEKWKEFINEPNDIQNQNQLPDGFQLQIKGFKKFLFIKSLRPELFVNYSKQFIKETLGEYFIKDLVISIADSFQDSSATIPLTFILSPGDDPQDEVEKLAKEQQRYLTFISLGKGQGQYAEQQIKESVEIGNWVILQNCHLAVSWLPRLEQIVENIIILENKKDKQKKFNPDFRLWLTSASSPDFPLSLLQKSIKMTKDPPKGIKANMIELYQNLTATKEDRQWFEKCNENKQNEWKRLVISLSFFHSIIRERRRFGPIGWNILYDFNRSDFSISIKQLKSMLNQYDIIPFKALVYLTGQCYYGGKVTDDWDRRVLDNMLQDFYNENVVANSVQTDSEDIELEEGQEQILHSVDETKIYRFSKVDDIYVPQMKQLRTLDKTLNFINNQLPDTNNPEVFGLHQSANISSATYEQTYLVDCLLLVSDGTSKGNNQDQNQQILQRVQQLLDQLPNNFDVEQVSLKYEIKYLESMNTVLIQEILRYNTLLNLLRISMQDLILALQGFKVMTNELDSVLESISNNKIPQSWLNKSYPSLKTLMGYHKDLLKRIEMFQNWIDNSIPNVFWISGFYFTQSFFTGIRQNYSRQLKIPIDKVIFDFQIIDYLKYEDIITQPDIGCFIHGLFMEGAQWNYNDHCLDEPDNQVIYKESPIIQFIPTENPQGRAMIKSNNMEVYECPIYKTIERKGTLSTTGHSTNFILSIDMPTKMEAKHWVKRGVAQVSQLND